MRRNPRPLRPVDRRKLVMDRIEREARSMGSDAAVLGAASRGKPTILTLPKRAPPREH
ncbi:MAG: hypothetical protein ACREU9_00115 [Gammaproteobacteria bacterium]